MTVRGDRPDCHRAIADHSHLDTTTCSPEAALGQAGSINRPSGCVKRSGPGYEICALASFRGHPMIQEVNQWPLACWAARWLVDVTHRTSPRNQGCDVLLDECFPLIGPGFLLASDKTDSAMVEFASNMARFLGQRRWMTVQWLESLPLASRACLNAPRATQK